MSIATVTQLQTNKQSLNETRVVTAPIPALRPGEALLRIDRLALTSNNVTYAAFGDVGHLRYWSFFPTGEDTAWVTCQPGASPTW